METKANHLLIGFVTLAGLLLALAFGLWAASFRTDAGWQEFEVHFTQAVSGLTVGSVVQFNGITMGNVRDLYLDPEDARRVIAVTRIAAEVPLCEDTAARLIVNVLTGVSFIQLRGGCVDSPRLVARPGQRPVITADESGLQRVIDQTEDIAGAASEVMLRILDFLSEENAARVSETLDSLNAMATAIADERDTIGELMQNVRQGSERANALIAELEKTAAAVSQLAVSLETELAGRLPEVAADVQATLAHFAAVAERIDQVVADNEHALAEFGQETLAQLGPAVHELRQLLRELARTTSRFEQHPARFILGGDRPEEFQPR